MVPYRTYYRFEGESYYYNSYSELMRSVLKESETSYLSQFKTRAQNSDSSFVESHIYKHWCALFREKDTSIQYQDHWYVCNKTGPIIVEEVILEPVVKKTYDLRLPKQ